MSDNLFVFDLNRKLQHDSSFRNEVTQTLAATSGALERLEEGVTSSDEVSSAFAQLLRVSGYNMALLFPFYFPRYPFDTPLSLLARPYMPVMTCLAPNSRVTLLAGRQVGKCVTGETVVNLREGRKMSLAQMFDAGVKIA